MNKLSVLLLALVSFTLACGNGETETQKTSMPVQNLRCTRGYAINQGRADAYAGRDTKPSKKDGMQCYGTYTRTSFESDYEHGFRAQKNTTIRPVGPAKARFKKARFRRIDRRFL